MQIQKIKQIVRAVLGRASPVLLAFLCNTSVAFAAGEEAAAFSVLSTALEWIRNIMLIFAALSVASYAFSFFFVSGGESEKKMEAAKKRMIATCIATAVFFIIPEAVDLGQNAVETFKWKSGSEVLDQGNVTSDTIKNSLSGNHILTPANPDAAIADVEQSEGSGDAGGN